MVGPLSLYSGMSFSLLSFSIPAQLTLFLALLWTTSATHCYNQVIVLMISATSCWVKWREALVRVWIEGRHRHTDRLHVQTMENASLNRHWLNIWWLKFHYRQEDNYSLFQRWRFSFVLIPLPEFILLFCVRVNTLLPLSFCWSDLYTCTSTFVHLTTYLHTFFSFFP